MKEQNKKSASENDKTWSSTDPDTGKTYYKQILRLMQVNVRKTYTTCPTCLDVVSGYHRRRPLAHYSAAAPFVAILLHPLIRVFFPGAGHLGRRLAASPGKGSVAGRGRHLAAEEVLRESFQIL